MKKNKIIIVALVIILVVCCILLGFVMSFNDDEGTKDNELFKVSCDTDSLRGGNEISCKLKASIKDYKVSAISATIVESSDYELIEVTPYSSWEGDGENGDIDLYTDVNKTGDFNIAEFRLFLINKDIDKIEVIVEDNSFFDQEFLEYKVSNINKKVSVKN